jgi:hypothetical protein
MEARGGEERIRQLMMSMLDGELDSGEQEELRRLFAADPALEKEWDGLVRLKEVTDTMRFRKPSDGIWEVYWTSVYSRLERGIGWILLSLGAIVLISYGAWKGVQGLVADAGVPLFLKGAILATVVGLVVLLVSVLREKLFMKRRERYKDVDR